MRYVPINNILSKIGRDSTLDVSEADVVEWAAEALGHIGAISQYDEAVSFVEVKNHTALIPPGLVSIIQIARSTCYQPSKGVCAKDIVPSPDEPQEKWPVPIDCNGQPVADYELAYYRPYFDLIYEYEGWSRSWQNRNCFTPVRLADHTFFNSLVATADAQLQDIYNSAQDEYTVADPYLRFSFKEGFVAIAYVKPKLDERGWPMIPDIESYREAIVRYVRYKLMWKRLEAEASVGNMRLLEKSEQDWQWYCKQAGNEGMMPKGPDDMQDLLDQKSYMLPRQYRYYGFFGRMNAPERRFWNYDSNIQLFRGYPAIRNHT